MEPITLEQVQWWTGGRGQALPTCPVLHVSTDTRTITKGSLFVPLVGERFDGHDFIQTAFECGAVAVLSEKPLPDTLPVIYVQDTKQALLDLASGYRMQFSAKVIGVTGSVGKTTTKEMLASVLARRFTTLKTQGNLNNEIGMPRTLLEIEKSTQMAVIEMGMNHFGEMARLSCSAKPDVAVITNIGTAHIEFLGSREGICSAKLEILQGLSLQGVAVLCADESLLWDKRGTLPRQTVYYGIENPDADIVAEHIQSEGTLVRFDICNRKLWDCRALPVGERIRAHLSVAGRHNVQNALAVAAVALLQGEEPFEIVAGLADYQPDGLRQNVYTEHGYLIFSDCYNASPDSMEAALAAFAEIETEGKKVAALGGMLELGAYHTEGHLRAGRAAGQCAQQLFLYGVGQDVMRQGAIEAGMPADCIFCFDTHEALAHALAKHTQTGDAILFKGSRGMQMELALARFMQEVKA